MVRLVLGKRRGAVFPFVLHGADGEVAVARHRLRGVGSRHVADIGAIAVPARGGHGAGDRRVVRPAIIQPHGGACRAGRIVEQRRHRLQRGCSCRERQSRSHDGNYASHFCSAGLTLRDVPGQADSARSILRKTVRGS